MEEKIKTLEEVDILEKYCFNPVFIFKPMPLSYNINKLSFKSSLTMFRKAKLTSLLFITELELIIASDDLGNVTLYRLKGASYIHTYTINNKNKKISSMNYMNDGLNILVGFANGEIWKYTCKTPFISTKIFNIRERIYKIIYHNLSKFFYVLTESRIVKIECYSHEKLDEIYLKEESNNQIKSLNLNLSKVSKYDIPASFAIISPDEYDVSYKDKVVNTKTNIVYENVSFDDIEILDTSANEIHKSKDYNNNIIDFENSNDESDSNKNGIFDFDKKLNSLMNTVNLDNYKERKDNKETKEVKKNSDNSSNILRNLTNLKEIAKDKHLKNFNDEVQINKSIMYSLLRNLTILFYSINNPPNIDILIFKINLLESINKKLGLLPVNTKLIATDSILFKKSNLIRKNSFVLVVLAQTLINSIVDSEDKNLDKNNNSIHSNEVEDKSSLLVFSCDIDFSGECSVAIEFLFSFKLSFSCNSIIDCFNGNNIIALCKKEGYYIINLYKGMREAEKSENKEKTDTNFNNNSPDNINSIKDIRALDNKILINAEFGDLELKKNNNKNIGYNQACYMGDGIRIVLGNTNGEMELWVTNI